MRRNFPVSRRAVGALAALIASLAALPSGSAASALPADSGVTLAGSYLAALSASAQNDTVSAARFLGQALSADPDNPQLIERTFLLRVANGDIDAALPLATAMLRAGRQNPTAYFALAVGSIKRGAYAEAAADLATEDEDAAESLTGAPLTALTTTLLRAWALTGTGKTDEAMAALEELNGPDWFEVFKFYHLGLIAGLAGRTDEAADWLRRAYESNGASMRVLDAYARALIADGNSMEANRLVSDYLRQSPGDPTMSALAADIAAGQRPVPLAGDAVEGAAEALYAVGTILGPDTGQDLAMTHLQLALYLEPDFGNARLALGSVYQARDAHEMALEEFARVPAGSTVSPEAAIQSAISLDALDRTAEAATTLQPVVASDPSDLYAVLALGSIYRTEERDQDAIDIYTAGIKTIAEVNESHWRIFYFRGIAYERAKQWALAEPDFRKALELAPDQPQVLNYLGYSLADQGIKLDEALEMIGRAVDLSPDDGYIVDSLGWAYYRMGRYEEAVTELERAVELTPEDPVINDHLGDAYWRVGRKLEAMFQWSHARDLDPTPEELARIVEKLANGMTEDAANDG
jgi:tetratricopeptide (TPR) repeat protein